MAVNRANRPLLLEILASANRPPQLAAQNGSELVALAIQQMVHPLLYQTLTESGALVDLPESTRRTLAGACRKTAQRNLSMRAATIELARAFQAEAIPMVALKGTHLAASVYSQPALRHMSDLDALVPAPQLARAVDIARALGFKSQRDFSVEHDVRILQHVTALYRHGVALELHWNITPPGRKYSMDPAALWRDTETIPSLPGVYGLSPANLLMHVCVHATLMHGCETGLRPYTDIAAIVVRYRDRLDWAALVDEAERRGWKRGMFLALLLAHRLLGAGVPDDVLADARRVTAISTLDAAEELTWAFVQAAPITRGASEFIDANWLGRWRLVRRRLGWEPSQPGQGGAPLARRGWAAVKAVANIVASNASSRRQWDSSRAAEIDRGRHHRRTVRDWLAESEIK